MVADLAGDVVAASSLIASIASLIAALAAFAKARQVHDEIQTGNGHTIGEGVSNIEKKGAE